jgi:hypothetical protein
MHIINKLVCYKLYIYIHIYIYYICELVYVLVCDL